MGDVKEPVRGIVLRDEPEDNHQGTRLCIFSPTAAFRSRLPLCRIAVDGRVETPVVGVNDFGRPYLEGWE